MSTSLPTSLLLCSLGLLACQTSPSKAPASETPAATDSRAPGQTPLQTANAGQKLGSITVPAGFQIQLLHEGVGSARHMVTRPNGDVFVRLQSPQQGKCLVALRDADKNGSLEQVSYFGDSECGTGLAIDDKYLYYSSRQTLYRQALPAATELVPTAAAEMVASGLGQPSGHSARSLALDGQGHIFVNIGAPSNACQAQDRQRGSAGQDPCPLLQEFGGVYRFDLKRLNQDKVKDGLRYATGIRNAVALDWHPGAKQLFVVQHGRDQLDTLYPDLYSAADNAELPAEELAAMQQGDNLGWPYCYYDPKQKAKVLAPEYGGDGKRVGRCAGFKQPLAVFPAHYAPNDLLIYRGKAFPATYQQGAFIAFHGSWNRAPLEQDGYNVVFVPLKNGQLAGDWQVFADGFEGPSAVSSPGQAQARPMGLAEHPDGSLLVVDSVQGQIWKISPAVAAS